MQTVNIICIGKLKEKYLRDASDEYSKRLGAFCRLNIIELTEERLADNFSAADIRTVIDKEGERILSKIPAHSYVVAMCIEGKQRTSEELAGELSALAVSGRSSVTFIIGGSYGLSAAVKSKADIKLSMSKLTFPHQLARVMLLEQIYRCFQINGGGKYHK